MTMINKPKALSSKKVSEDHMKEKTETFSRRRKQIAKRNKIRDIAHNVIFDQLDLDRGNLSECAKNLNVTYTDLVGYVHMKEDLTQLLVLSREKIIDAAEKQLMSHIDQGSLKASMFALETIGKHRGYVKQKVDNGSEDLNKAKVKVDLTKLSTDQLTQLQGILTDADGPKTIDITPNPD